MSKDNNEFAVNYDFQLVEKSPRFNYWTKIIKNSSNKFTSTLLLPPPNITGNLHLGHAFETIIQDFLVRFSYLIQKPIYWIAGIDHAGISTQNKVEKLQLSELDTDEKKKEYTFKIWYPQTRYNFYEQWKKLGLLIDYEGARFTLDPTIQKQVKQAFIKLYQDGLIYRDRKIVNWDSQLKSVISDIEVEHKTNKSKLYYLKYFFNNNDNDYLLVATTRPETIFVDVALFVNPYDLRYKKCINNQVKHPWTRKIIPILSDKTIKENFGSGVLKCTPGHDFIDYELAKKYHLPIISCTDERGILNELAGEWKGRKIGTIREEIVDRLVEKNICIKIEEYENTLAYSSKSGVIIEPLLSWQWFIDLPILVKKIKKKAPNFLSEINFVPRQFKKKINDWCNEVHEWCISRQLWWGHSIPAWYHKKTKEIFVGEKLDKCFCVKNYKNDIKKSYLKHECKLQEWKAEKDVLDTWFSSSLWPLIVLAKEETFPFFLFNYYPITTLVTGYDILFFWVLKMILLGTYFSNKAPFKQIILHGLVRDKQGKKMSKSLGNGVEPDELVSKYGCDSLRLFFLENNIWGSDLIYEESKIIGSWRFCQKLWSVGNLIIKKVPKIERKEFYWKGIEKNQENLIDNWILNELNLCQKDIFILFDKKNISLIVAKLVKFTREKLSNEYLKLVKTYPWNKNVVNTVLFVYQQLLTILHPIIPFITEYLYQEIFEKKILESKIIVIETKKNENLWQIDCILTLLRNIRCSQEKNSEFYLELEAHWKDKINNFSNSSIFSEILEKNKIKILEKKDKKFNAFISIKPFGVLWYQKQVEQKGLEKQLKFYEKEWQRSKSILENKNFISKAPSKIISEEKKKFAYYYCQKIKTKKLIELIAK